MPEEMVEMGRGMKHQLEALSLCIGTWDLGPHCNGRRWSEKKKRGDGGDESQREGTGVGYGFEHGRRIPSH